MKWMKHSLVSLLVILVCCNNKHNQQQEELHVVKKVDLHDILSRSGVVTPVVKIDLKSEASGKIEKLFVKEGQKIYKGDTLLLIDPSRLITQRQKLELTVREAEIEFLKSQRDVSDGKELQYNGSLSDKKLFDLEMKHQLDSINLKRQKLELIDIQDQLSKTVITSPMNGIITHLPVEEGEIAVSATTGYQNGTDLATIADISKLEVITTIGEVDYINIRNGQTVSIKPEALENQRTKGTISFVALSAKKDDKNELSGFEVRILIDSIIPGIAPGINTTVEFTVKEKFGIIGIPVHLVEKTDSAYYVYRKLKNPQGVSSIQKTTVTIGETDFRHYEIISGLDMGDTITPANNIKLFPKDNN